MLLTEHFVTLIPNRDNDTKQMMELAPDVYEKIQKAYAYCGGIAKANNLENFITYYIESPKIGMWKLVRRGNDITAGCIYRVDRGGRKSVCGFSDGTDRGKKDLAKIFQEDYTLKERGAWSEKSGKALTFALKQGAELVPAEVAKELIDPDIEVMPDGFFYKRSIRGLGVRTKALVGFPPSDMRGYKLDEETYQKFKNLAIQYEKEDDEKNLNESLKNYLKIKLF